VSTKNEGIKNIGQLNVRNAKTFITENPYCLCFDEVIITAEEQGDIMYPSGTEISRTRIK
jgi:hypothetical protein